MLVKKLPFFKLSYSDPNIYVYICFKSMHNIIEIYFICCLKTAVGNVLINIYVKPFQEYFFE